MSPVSRVFALVVVGAVGTIGLFAGPPSGGRTASASRPFSAPVRTPATIGLIPSTSGFTGINPGALPTHFGYGYYSGYASGRGYGRNYRGLPLAYYFTPYYYPGLLYDSGGYDSQGYAAGAPPYGVDPATDSLAAGQGYLGQQIQQLSDQVNQLQSAQQAQSAGRSGPGAGAQSNQADTPPVPPVTLVLRNGQQLQVKNYAVMAEVFWDFTNPIAKKIPLANIDIPASAKATEAQGGEFPQIGQ